ncbi:MAG: carbohydrate porin [Candidatus Omnitrophica bacterium]|nr:carbohydrate porin [Candidatus Omnitrophota bacterium]
MFKKVFQGLFMIGLFFLPGNIVFSQSIQDEFKETFDGLTIGAGATFIIQGTYNANGDALFQNGEDVVDASYSVDLELEKKIADYGKAFFHLETGDGAGVEDELKVFSSVNRDMDDSDNNVSLTEAWYEHYFKTLPLTLTFGKVDATSYIDTNEYANDECTQFLGRIFRNSPVLEFPDDNAAGAHFLLEPDDFMDVGVVAMDATADWEDAFDNVFVSGQLNIKPKLLGKPGNYRVYCWLNDKEHTKWKDSTKTKEKGYGVGLSFDQELTDNLGVFTRYGWQNKDVFMNGEDLSLEHSWSVGLEFAGSLWGKTGDAFAIAFGQVLASREYKEVNSLKAKSEEHLEAYYNYKVNNHLTLSPDFQVIWDPYGGDAANGDNTIVVVGLRTQVDF